MSNLIPDPAAATISWRVATSRDELIAYPTLAEALA